MVFRIRLFLSVKLILDTNTVKQQVVKGYFYEIVQKQSIFESMAVDEDRSKSGHIVCAALEESSNNPYMAVWPYQDAYGMDQTFGPKSRYFGQFQMQFYLVCKTHIILVLFQYHFKDIYCLHTNPTRIFFEIFQLCSLVSGLQHTHHEWRLIGLIQEKEEGWTGFSEGCRALRGISRRRIPREIPSSGSDTAQFQKWLRIV